MIFPQSLLLLKKNGPLWYVPLKIPWLFNYSVSCLMVILLDPCYNNGSYFWRLEQARLIIWSGLLHNVHHSVLLSDLCIKPCILWEFQSIFYFDSKLWRIYHILGYPFQTYVAFMVRTFAIWIFLIFHLSSVLLCSRHNEVSLVSFMPCKTSGWDLGSLSISYSDRHTT